MRDPAKERLKEWFLENVYGFAPIGRPDDMTFEGNSIVFGGGRMKVDLIVALPKGASKEKPCPVLVMGDFRTWNNGVHDNDYTRKEQAKQDAMDAYATSRGYAMVHYNLNEAAPDQPRRKAWEALGLTGMGGHVGYHCHKGGHNFTVEDLKPFLDFCDKAFSPKHP